MSMTLFIHNAAGGEAGWGGPVRVRVESPAAAPAGFFDVRQFGAKGNGFDDDTAALRAALVRAGEAGGGTVFLPPGRYALSATLWIPPHVTLQGAGPHNSILAVWDERPMRCSRTFCARGGLAFGKSIISHSLPSRRSRDCESHVSIVGRGESPLAQRFDRNIEVRTECETRVNRLRMDERPEVVLALTGSDLGEVASIGLGASSRAMTRGRRWESLRRRRSQPAAGSRINRRGREEGCPGSTCLGTSNSVFLTVPQNSYGHRPSTV